MINNEEYSEFHLNKALVYNTYIISDALAPDITVSI